MLGEEVKTDANGAEVKADANGATEAGKAPVNQALSLLRTCREIFVNNSKNHSQITEQKKACDEELARLEKADASSVQVLELKAQSNTLREELQLFESLSICKENNMEEIYEQASQYVVAIRQILAMEGAQQNDNASSSITTDLLSGEVLLQLVNHLPHFSFESGRDVGLIFKFLFQQKKNEATQFMEKHLDFLPVIINGYENDDIAHVCGSIIRQCARQESLCRYLIHHADLYKFFGYVRKSKFEIASDAFATFALILTKHKGLVTDFLLENFDVFLKQHWNDLVSCRTYVTCRQSLNTLRDILTERKNFKVMMKYILDPECLDILIWLMLGKKNRIKNDCFDIFKIFVLNPRKTDEIKQLLVQKKDKLIISLDAVKQSAECEKVKLVLTKLEPLPPPPES